MNKNLIYLGVLALALSHTVLERLIGLFIRNNTELAADVSSILFLVYILLIPIVIACLARLWKLELKKAILVYGLVILLVSIVKSGWMLYAFYPEVTVGMGLFNIITQTIIPLAVFTVCYKLFSLIKK